MSVARFAGTAIFAIAFSLSQRSALARDLSFPGLDEVRLGGAYSVDRSGHNGYVHFEALFSPLPAVVAYDPKWRWLLSPRPLIGMAVSPSGKTNEFFAGFGWTLPGPGGFFVEFSAGGLVHDQKLSDTYSDQPGPLTTRFLFRESIAIGYEINSQWRVVAFADHASNGNLGYRNISANQAGLMLGGKLGQREKETPVAAPIASFSWAGPFAGFHAGIVRGNYNFAVFEPGAGTEASSASAGSLDIGGQLGHNWVFGSLVMGLEGDFSAQHTTSSIFYDPEQEDFSAALYWLATARARIGLDIQQLFLRKRFLLYGTGGAAFARSAISHCHHANRTRPGEKCYDANADVAGGWIADASIRTGWTAGAGVEIPIAANVSVKFEHMYAKFGKSRFAYGPITNDVDVSEHVFRAGGNIKLN